MRYPHRHFYIKQKIASGEHLFPELRAVEIEEIQTSINAITSRGDNDGSHDETNRRG